MQETVKNAPLGVRLFTSTEAWLIVGAMLGVYLVNANYHLYEMLAHGHLHLVYEEFHWELGTSTHFVVVDVLMAFFFFVVGAELKIDFTDKQYGAFKKPSDAIAPGVGAIGGVVLPAGICAVLAADYAAQAFGVPMATDIAFTLAIASMMGLSRPEMAFLKALAVIDDVIGVLVIAFFYGDGPELATWSVALVGMLALFYVGYGLKWQSKGWYLIGMAVLWWLFYRAGIHPTLAGVVAGFAAPHASGDMYSTARRIEHVFNQWMQPWILFCFAFVSCGVYLPELAGELNYGVMLGVGAGLFIGKPLGIWGSLYLLRKATGREPLFDRRRIPTIGALAGFGFTVALFVNGLAFEDQTLLLSGKLGIFAGSFASVLLALVLHVLSRKQISVPEAA